MLIRSIIMLVALIMTWGTLTFPLAAHAAGVKYKPVSPKSPYYCGKAGKGKTALFMRSPNSPGGLKGISFDKAEKLTVKELSAVRKRIDQLYEFRDELEENSFDKKDLRQLLGALKQIKDLGLQNVKTDLPGKRGKRLNIVRATISKLQARARLLERQRDGIGNCDKDRLVPLAVAWEVVTIIDRNEHKPTQGWVKVGLLITAPSNSIGRDSLGRVPVCFYRPGGPSCRTLIPGPGSACGSDFYYPFARGKTVMQGGTVCPSLGKNEVGAFDLISSITFWDDDDYPRALEDSDRAIEDYLAGSPQFRLCEVQPKTHYVVLAENGVCANPEGE